MRYPLTLALLSAGFLVAAPQTPATETPKTKSTKTKTSGDAVDTTRDSRAKGPTADQQKENESDRKLTQQIRRAVQSDKSISMMGHQAKIVATNGAVTLRGVVRTEEEKRAIEQHATEVVGAGKVTNELTVSPNNTTDREAQKAASKKKS
jgi:osmotically-inducible protein OsmY